ncbi:hypothetical protein SUDANB15_00241 [Streptomyces sp. enrichment culture]
MKARGQGEPSKQRLPLDGGLMGHGLGEEGGHVVGDAGRSGRALGHQGQVTGHHPGGREVAFLAVPYVSGGGDAHSGQGHHRPFGSYLLHHAEHHGAYGASRVHAELRARGRGINRKRPARLVRINRVVGRHLRKRKRTTTVDRWLR